MPELTLRTDSKFESTLEQLVEGNPNAQSKADIVQRAVATYKYLQDALNNNKQIQLVDSTDPSKILESDLRLP